MEFQEILLSAIGIILTTLATWASERLISWLNTKIKNTKYAKYLADALDVTSRVVKATYQTYVESMKGQNAFTEDAQKKALTDAKNAIIKQLSEETKVYIEKNFNDVDAWIESSIEAVIYDLKNKPKEGKANEQN